MTLYKKIIWHSFEEVLALAMGWPLVEAKERAQQYDAAAGEPPFEFPDRIDELIAEAGDPSGWKPFDASAFYVDGSDSGEQAKSHDAVPPENLKDYIFFKERLKEAVKHDIQYQELRDDDGWTVLGHVLNPTHVSKWLNVMQYRDMSKLHDRIAELEKENTRLRKELQQGNKYDEQITSMYLDIAIKTYYKVWHNRDPSLAVPSQEAIWSELHDDYPSLSEVTRKAIEKVCCPIDRNPAKKKK